MKSPSVGVDVEDQPHVEETLPKLDQRVMMRPIETLWGKGKNILGDITHIPEEKMNDPVMSAFWPFQVDQPDATVQVEHDAILVMEEAMNKALQQKKSGLIKKRKTPFFQGLIKRAQEDGAQKEAKCLETMLFSQ